MTASDLLAELARKEVLALHEFFVTWFRRDGPDIDFRLCEAAFADDFRMVTPDGLIHGRAAIVEMVRRARGALPDDFAIVISEIEPLWQQQDAILLGYIEQQYRNPSVTRRRSTALFTAEPSAPRGVVWRHLQETWLTKTEQGENR
jgi:hypothetical protein